jgi:hypothetical protein
MKMHLPSILSLSLALFACGGVDDPSGAGGTGGAAGSAGAAGAAGSGGGGGGTGPILRSCDSAEPGPFGECSTNIYTVRLGGSIADEVLVGVTGVVTAIRINADGLPSHLVLQMPTDDADYAGPDYSGVWVYLNNARDETIRNSPPPVGSRIRLVAGTNTHYEQRQLQHVAHIEVLGQAEVPAPVVVAAGEVATNGPRAWALEGVLVQVQSAMVTALEPEVGPGDGQDPEGNVVPTNEFVVNDVLRVNDYLFFADPLPRVGALFVELTGILRFGNANSKIEVRNISDLNPAV